MIPVRSVRASIGAGPDGGRGLREAHVVANQRLHRRRVGGGQMVRLNAWRGLSVGNKLTVKLRGAPLAHPLD